MDAPNEKWVRACSFCGKSQRQTRKVIAGPGVYICDKCVVLCSDIIEDELDSDPAGDARAAERLLYEEVPRLYERLHNAFTSDPLNLSSADVAVLNRLQRVVEIAGRKHSHGEPSSD